MFLLLFKQIMAYTRYKKKCRAKSPSILNLFLDYMFKHSWVTDENILNKYA